MGTAFDHRRAVRQVTGALPGVDHGNVIACFDGLHGRLLHGDADVAAALRHRAGHQAGAVKDAAIQILHKGVDQIRRLPRQGLNHGAQGRIAGAGDGGVGKGDFPPPGFLQQAFPAHRRIVLHQLGVVNQYQRQGGKRGAGGLPRIALRHLFHPGADIRRKAIGIGAETVHPAAEHQVAVGVSGSDPLQQLRGAAGHQLHPDPGTLLKFLHNGGIDLFLMGGVYHQPVLFCGSVGRARLPRLPGAAGQQD